MSKSEGLPDVVPQSVGVIGVLVINEWLVSSDCFLGLSVLNALNPLFSTHVNRVRRLDDGWVLRKAECGERFGVDLYGYRDRCVHMEGAVILDVEVSDTWYQKR